MLSVSRDLHGTCWLSWVDLLQERFFLLDKFLWIKHQAWFRLTFDFSISDRFLLMRPAASLPNRSNLWLGASKLDEAMIFGEKGGGAEGVHLDGKFKGGIGLMVWYDCFTDATEVFQEVRTCWELLKKQVGRLQMFQLGYQVQFQFHGSVPTSFMWET